MRFVLAFLVTGASLFAQSAASINFRPNLPGIANGRNMEHKGVEHLSIADFGAKGDGVTDDTVAVWKALTALCLRGGGYLDISFGAYLIKPFATSSFLPACSHLTIRGLNGTLKVANGAGSYDAIFGTKSQELSDFHLSDVVIDANSTGNPTTTHSDMNSHPRIVLEVGTSFHLSTTSPSSDVSINNVTVKDFQGVWAFLICAHNSGVTSSRFLQVGGPTAPDNDSSIIYMEGEREQIQGNTFVATAVNSPMAITAIETHGSQSVTGNQIYGFQVGMNITGIARSTSTGVVVADNAISGTFQCIDIWSYDVLGATGYGVSDSGIHGNTCIVNQLSYLAQETAGAQTFGINLNGASTLPFRNLYEHDDTVTFDLSTATSEPFNTASLGIGYFDVASTGTPCENCHFDHDTVRNAPLVAFRFSAAGSYISFDDDHAINPGSHLNASVPDAYKSGLLFGYFSGPYPGVFSIKGGTYEDTLSTARMKYGILAASLNTRGIVIDGPTISCSDLTCASLLSPVAINSSTQKPYVRATVDVPVGVARAVINTPIAGSSIMSLREAINYIWDGTAWQWITPHNTALTTSNLSGCGSGASVGGTDRAGTVQIGTGASSCVISFATAFGAQPVGAVTPYQQNLSTLIYTVCTTITGGAPSGCSNITIHVAEDGWAIGVTSSAITITGAASGDIFGWNLTGN